MKAINLDKVTFSYDEKTNVLENASFSADFGKITLVAGHSGCGKSTLLSIISGIIPNIVNGTLTGTIEINGVSIVGKKLGEICRSVGVVLQNADEQIVHKIVEDEIAFGCENLAFKPDVINKQITIVCKLLGLNRKSHTRTLSGGQKQKLITASTLAMGQKIIILDEPLANLDKEGSLELIETLKKLTKVGYCIIIVEHRLDVVLPFVDEVYHIGDKQITKVINKNEYLKEQSIKIEDTCKPYILEKPIFSLKDVTINFKDAEVLKGVTCDILNHSRTVLLGENGCGKTTLMRILAKLYKVSSGEVKQFIDPKFDKLKKGNKKWYKMVGVVYQNPDYQLFMPTVRKELEFGAVSSEYALNIAKIFDLMPLLDRHPQSLSEGQKRRVSIASVVATKPDILLLDEPTVGQDYDGLDKLVHILNNLHEENHFTMVTITHDVRCAEALTDIALLLEKGKITKIGGKELVRDYFDHKIN